MRSTLGISPLASQHFTKSRYIAGLQCLRRLWLVVNEPIPYEKPPPGSPIDVGQEIGRKAHLLFPGGLLIDEEPWRHASSLKEDRPLFPSQDSSHVGNFIFGSLRSTNFLAADRILNNEEFHVLLNLYVIYI